MQRIILDTNIWRYLLDCQQVNELRRLAIRYRKAVVIPPSIVYEILRVQDPELRSGLARAVSDPYWKKLMPEAFSEANELLSEIRRLRPEWILNVPPNEEYNRQVWDWRRNRGGFWDRVRNDAANLAVTIHDLEGDQISTARKQEQENGINTKGANWTFETTELDQIFYVNTKDISDIAEPWRIEGERYVNSQLISQPRGPFDDWLFPFLNIGLLTAQEQSWSRFWQHDIESSRMPRWWMRWAFATLAATRKNSNGTPCDIQLATYLFECDTVMSADRIFIEVVRACKKYSPSPLACAELVRAGENSLNDIEQLMKS